MWIAGVGALLAIGSVAIVSIGWEPRQHAEPPTLDLSGQGGAFTGIVGAFAGFTVASVTFMAGLDAARGSPAYAATIAMFLISFLILMGSAMMYSDTSLVPVAHEKRDVTFQSLSNVLVIATYFLGLALSWLGLRPLLLMIGLVDLAAAFTWLLLATVLAGSVRIAVYTYRLTSANGRACVSLPTLGILLPAIYWLLANHFWPVLWPEPDAAVKIAFVAIAVASVGVLHQSALFAVHESPGIEREFRQHGHRFALGYLQMVTIAVELAWFAVAAM
jgi:hypothetical protein